MEPIKDADSDVFSSSKSDVGLAEGDPSFYGKSQGIITEERMTKIMLRYGVPLEFLCRLQGDSECIFYLGPMEVAVCEEMFRVRFFLPLHPFIKWLLNR